MKPLQDGIHYYNNERIGDSIQENALLIYAYEDGKVADTLLRESWLKTPHFPDGLEWDDVELSPDESVLLLATQSESIYRYSTKAVYYVWSRSNRSLAPLMDSARVTAPAFSPDGRSIAFVYLNDLYIKDMERQQLRRITSDGAINQIINGHGDWVYEEELELTRAFAWSPDSKALLYLRFDESQVPQMSIPLYEGNLYPREMRFKYPKAGEANAAVSLWLLELDQAAPRCLVQEDPRTGDDADHYLARIGWTRDAGLAWVQTMNRAQNRLDLSLIDRQSGERRLLRREQSETWVDLHDHLVFLNNGTHFVHSSERTGFQRLYLYDMQGREITALTHDGQEITDFYGVDQARGEYYYALAAPTPMERQVYRASLPALQPDQPAPTQPVPAATLIGSESGKTSARFSTTYDYYVLQHTTASQPLRVSLHRREKEIRVLQDNQSLQIQMQSVPLGPKSFHQIPGADSTLLNAYIIHPKEFNPKKRYPLLMFVYGGPGSQTVDASLGQYYMWFQYLTTLGYVVASVDGRGTGYRGAAFEKAIYGQLGKHECDDQIAAARYLGKLPWVDAQRIGIFGWSFGGYLSSLAITKGADVFKAAVAVAPVINWRFYDSIYTERFLKTPAENAQGYDDNSPENHASKLKGNYLLIHGTADDNVHYQNAAVMAKRLVDLNKDFEFFTYTDKNHGISGGKTRLQLFSKITCFLQKNL
jgi:dipeptidyl-peptidase-4